jgi:hypothetical protein
VSSATAGSPISPPSTRSASWNPSPGPTMTWPAQVNPGCVDPAQVACLAPMHWRAYARSWSGTPPSSSRGRKQASLRTIRRRSRPPRRRPGASSGDGLLECGTRVRAATSRGDSLNEQREVGRARGTYGVVGSAPVPDASTAAVLFLSPSWSSARRNTTVWRSGYGRQAIRGHASR